MTVYSLAKLALSSLFLLLVLPAICLAGNTIRINGSGSALDMLKPMLTAYKKINKDVRISMGKPLGSSGATKALLGDALDLVLSSKPLKADEKAKGAQQQIYGKTPLVLITEKKITKKNITTRELEEIFNGKTISWPGGENIRLVLRPNEDVDSKILSDLSPGMNSAMQAARARAGMIIAVTDPDAYLKVQKTPGALGATGLTSIIAEKLNVSSLALNGVKASPATVGNGTYPLAKEISFVTTAKTSPATHKLIKFIFSPHGRAIAAKNGVIITARTTAGR